MNKLPPPYDENCRDNSEKQQFECMNECIEKFYNQKLKCFPNLKNYYTIMVDNKMSREKFIFCNESEFVSKTNDFFALKCQTECVEPCSIIYYEENLIPITIEHLWHEKYIQFIFDNVDYLKIIWLPQLTMISLFIKIVNIWSLWNGINFTKLIDHIFEYIKQLHLFIFRNINIRINWKNYFNTEITKVRIFSNIYIMCR